MSDMFSLTPAQLSTIKNSRNTEFSAVTLGGAPAAGTVT